MFTGLFYAAFGIYLIVSTIRSMGRGHRKTGRTFQDRLLLFSEVLFTVAGPVIGFSRFDAYMPDIPFAKHHVLSVMILTASSSAAFWLSRLTERTAGPELRILLSAGMLQGILLCAVVTVHFACYLLLGLVYPVFGFELLCPLFAFFLLCRQLYFYNKVTPAPDGLLPYREQLGIVPVQVRIFRQPLGTRLLIYGGLALAAVIAQMAAAYALGQDADSLIKAFTQSTGFVFSR